MRQRRLAAALAAGGTVVAFAGLMAGPASASPSAAHGGAPAAVIRWGNAQSVPRLAWLNKGNSASVSAISCWGRGGCAAAGSYADRHRHSQAWVAIERKGRWGAAAEVPGSGTLNRGGAAGISFSEFEARLAQRRMRSA